MFRKQHNNFLCQMGRPKFDRSQIAVLVYTDGLAEGPFGVWRWAWVLQTCGPKAYHTARTFMVVASDECWCSCRAVRRPLAALRSADSARSRSPVAGYGAPEWPMLPIVRLLQRRSLFGLWGLSSPKHAVTITELSCAGWKRWRPLWSYTAH